MKFLLVLLAAGLTADVLRWALALRRDLPPPVSPPLYRVAIRVGWNAGLAESTTFAAPFLGFMGGILSSLPLIFVLEELASREVLTGSLVRGLTAPSMLVGAVGGVILGIIVGRRARRAELPHLEVFQDRVVIPGIGPLKLAIRTVIPFSELTSLSAVRDDHLIIAGRRSSAVIAATDIASIASVPGIQEVIEAAAKESRDGADIARRIAEETKATEALVERSIPATNTIIIVLVAVYVLQWLAVSAATWTETLVRMGANLRGSWNHGQSYRLVTSSYLHANIFHLFSNLSGIVSVGILVERVIGSTRMFIVYALSALAGGFASSLVDSIAVGASTGLFGLIGASAFIQIRHGRRLPNTFQLNKASWIILATINGALPLLIPNISWAGHLGGVLAGSIVAVLIASSPESIDDRPASIALRAIAVLLIAMTLIAFAQGVRFFLSH